MRMYSCVQFDPDSVTSLKGLYRESLGINPQLCTTVHKPPSRPRNGGGLKYIYSGGKVYIELPPWPITITRTNGGAS